MKRQRAHHGLQTRIDVHCLQPLSVPLPHALLIPCWVIMLHVMLVQSVATVWAEKMSKSEARQIDQNPSLAKGPTPARTFLGDPRPKAKCRAFDMNFVPFDMFDMVVSSVRYSRLGVKSATVIKRALGKHESGTGQ